MGWPCCWVGHVLDGVRVARRAGIDVTELGRRQGSGFGMEGSQLVDAGLPAGGLTQMSAAALDEDGLGQGGPLVDDGIGPLRHCRVNRDHRDVPVEAATDP